MNAKIITSLCFCWVLLLSVPMRAQSPTQTPLTYEMLLPDFQKSKPTPAELGTYGAYETSEYTGAVDIGIPMYVAHSGNVSLPISLKYDATGIKVTQQASPVGLAWQLSLGGSITHVVNGQDDFNCTPDLTDKDFRDSIYTIAAGYHTPYVPQGYFVDWDLGLHITNLSQLLQNSSILDWRCSLIGDLAHGMHVPDVFHASFCGHGVSFTLDKQTGQVTILDDNACKYRIHAEYGNSIWPLRFYIVDDEGTTYLFQAYSEYDHLDCYYLTEIRGLNPKDVITISYAQYRQKGQYELYQSIGQIESVTASLPDGLSGFLGVHSQPANPCVYKDAVYPARIDSRQETIFFDLVDREDVAGAKAMGNILVVSKNGNVQTHKMAFSYGYFMERSRGEGKSTALVGAVDVNYSAKRLKLNGVVVDGKKYDFSYNEDVALPYVTSLSQDYWGYYNGIDNHDAFCSSPSYRMSTTLEEVKQVGKANRLASPRNMQCGLLKRIVYPTGGYTDFEFESHHFNDTYYYPRAEHPVCKAATSISVGSVAAQKDKPNGQSFTLTEDKDIEFIVNINSKAPQAHPCSATIWCANGNNYKEEFSTTVSTPGMTSRFTRHLKAGVYVIYVTVPYVPSDYTTTATITAITGYTCNMDSESSDISGTSIGGGVRIKSITNYDGKSSGFTSQTRYKYRGGKLLVPTVRRKDLTLHFSISGSRSFNTVTYSFVGSQKSELALMSMGVPTVGYSTVVKESIDQEGHSNGHEEFIFENIPYQEIAAEFYYYTNYGLNGRIVQKTVSSSNGDPVRKVRYTYGTKKYSEVLFPKCTPLFLPGTNTEGCTYQLSIYPKANVWNYLAKVEETNYVSGKSMRPKTIEYAYQEANYKERQILVQDGAGTQVKKTLFYPVGCHSQGATKLLERNALAEVTEMIEYRGKNTFLLTRGYRKDYEPLDNQNVVVSSFSSIGTRGVKREEMKVVRHDDYGNILEYTTSSGVHVVLLWSYSYQYPVMEIVGATYDEIVALLPLVLQLGNKSSLTWEEIHNLHTLVANKSKGHATAYLYNPFYKVSDIISPNGNIFHYDYDAYGRLMSEKDIDNNPLSTYKYNYRQ